MQIATADRPRKSRKQGAAGAERISLDVVYESAKILTGATDPISQMASVLNVLSSFMGLRHGAVALLADPDAAHPSAKSNPYVIAATSLTTELQPPSCGAIPEAVAALVFRTGVAMVSQDVVAEFGADALPPNARGDKMALFAVPIREQAKSPLVLGVLCVYRTLEEPSTSTLDNDLRVLTMIASLFEQSLRFRRLVARDRSRIMNEARNAVKAAQAGTGGAGNQTTPIDGIIGDSPEIETVIARIRKVAKTSAPVLLRGESGTGKELFARAIHALSERKDKPFVKLNCAALSETLLETELFGHEKGSFTGAMAQKKGRFELADGGTLFLDEIGEISHEFQAKLLRVLQEGEFERVGGTKTLRVDVRIVTATNRDLEDAVAKGDFRADLYFRICVIPIMLPPLRDRPGDIPKLAQNFLDRFNRENNLSLSFADDAFETLFACKFPGNVRELENCVSRVAALAAGPVIAASDMACQQDACLSAELWRLQSVDSSPIGGLSAGRVVRPIVNQMPPAAPSNCPGQPRKTANTERDELIAAMEQAGWVQAKAARLMGMTPRQIGYALKKHNIDIRKF
ncbi:MAG: nif-specific transcriptional activator NifA [Confluentimicrobium sp.]|jgi:Nif-specific regulatory protein|uniref:nif-specific transcriptional activator NifA n=1 Tax=Actibacterium sp. TaxID=1872125 RepID=UPI000C3E8E57|nr:nif-specific transcriptional activator NifA [Actibacterium sp.]MBC58486.1 nif-specific transcriptional activator NifA [Actibacterium sp.]